MVLSITVSRSLTHTHSLSYTHTHSLSHTHTHTLPLIHTYSFLLARDASSGELIGFVSFRFDVDEGIEVLYW